MITTNMAASNGSVGMAATSPCSPGLSRLEETENLRNLFLDCVRGYIVQAGSEANWPLVVRATTAMILLQRRRHPGREPRVALRSLLRSRETFGEYHHLVRDMRLDNGQEFFQYFRMTRQRFDHLHPSLQKETTFWREPIPPAERLALTIRYLAHGASQAICAVTFRTGRSTASEIILETCEALRAVSEPLYRPVPNTAQWKRIAAGFSTQWNFPNCVGALDGKHVPIEALPGAGSDTFNYKAFHSIVLMACCDASYEFTLVDVGQPGRYSDGGVFRNSEMGERILSDTAGLPPPAHLPDTRTKLPFVFVGDEAFPLLTNLMRPFLVRA